MAARLFTHTYVRHVQFEGISFNGFLGKLDRAGIKAAAAAAAPEMAVVQRPKTD